MKTILVIATRQIGDVFLTTPLIRAARQRWPGARIDVLGFERTLGMIQGNPDIDGLIETPARLGMGGALRLARRLWRRYDLALVTDAGDRAHLLGWIAGRTRSGVVVDGSGSAWWKRLTLAHEVRWAGDHGSVHALVEKQALLAPWIDITHAPIPATVPPAAHPLPATLEAVLEPGAVVVHAPSMWSYKQWPLEHFAVVIESLLAQGRQVVLTGSASERDQACIAPLKRLGQPPRLIDASGQLDFNQLTTLLARAALYIGPDTSVSHLAASTGTPTIAIFGPTNPLRWSPWPARTEQPVSFPGAVRTHRNGNVLLLQGPQACVPCGLEGCEKHRQSRSDCLPAIKPERVLREASSLLAAPLKSTASA